MFWRKKTKKKPKKDICAFVAILRELNPMFVIGVSFVRLKCVIVADCPPEIIKLPEGYELINEGGSKVICSQTERYTFTETFAEM